MKITVFSILIWMLIITRPASSQNPMLEYTIHISKNAATLETPTEVFLLNQGDVFLKTDLNGDGMQDLIIAFGNCGNWGDCVYGFFVANRGGKYQCVFEEYLPSKFEIGKTLTTYNQVVWKDFVVYERSSDALGNPVAVVKKMYIDSGRYTIK